MTAQERRLEALLRMLTEEGHMTPYARNKVVNALAEALARADTPKPPEESPGASGVTHQ